jgi:hypothetical protein
MNRIVGKMAKNTRLNREVLSFLLTQNQADRINILSNQKNIQAGSLVLEILEEAGVVGITADNNRRTSRVVPLIRTSVLPEHYELAKSLASGHKSVSEWAREKFEPILSRMEVKPKSISVNLRKRNPRQIFHPITGTPWVTPPFQGDSKWPMKYFITQTGS